MWASTVRDFSTPLNIGAFVMALMTFKEPGYVYFPGFGIDAYSADDLYIMVHIGVFQCLRIVVL